MNRNEYDTASYTGSLYRQQQQHQQQPTRSIYHQPPSHHHRNPHASGSIAAPSSRNDYDVDSMLSARLPPQRDYGQGGWDRRRSVVDTVPYNRQGSEFSHPLQSQYTRPNSSHGYQNPYEPKMEMSPPRREYSPLRKVSKGLDGGFKGFTTPLPGNDPGYAVDPTDFMDHGTSVRTPSSRRYSEVDRASLYRGLSLASGSGGGGGGGGASSQLAGSGGNELYSGSESRYRYGRPDYGGGGGSGGGGGGGTSSYLMDNYGQEQVPSQYLHSATKSRYDEPHSHSAEGYRSWDANPVAASTAPPSSSPCWDSVASNQMSPRMGEQPLSPRTFKRECQRAFKEARAQRMRNLEEGLYGKCDWATFDAKYC